MFLGKVLTGFAASLVLSITANAAPSEVSVTAGKDGNQRITVLISRNSALATKTSDAVIKSPLVHEVATPGGATYQGDGFALSFNSPNMFDSDVVLTLDVASADNARLDLRDGSLTASATDGAIHNFYQALLASESFGVVKSNEEEVFLLEGSSLNDPHIRCGGEVNNPGAATCDFQLN